MRTWPFIAGALLMLAHGGSPGVARERTVSVDKAQVLAWNRFAKGLYDAHRQLIDGRSIRKEERVGGYARHPRYYREISYFEPSSDRLLARVRWERDRPSILHSVELFIYSPDGRLIRGLWRLLSARGTKCPHTDLDQFFITAKPTCMRFGSSMHRANGSSRSARAAGSANLSSIEIEEPLIATPASLTNSEAYTACFGLPAGLRRRPCRPGPCPARAKGFDRCRG